MFGLAELGGDKWMRLKAANLLFNPGDGTITRQSLFGRPPNAQPAVAVPMSMRSPRVGTAIFCDTHNGLTRDRTVQDNLLTELILNR
jgi:hypothetical protein